MSSERFTTIYDVVDKSLEIIVDNNTGYYNITKIINYIGNVKNNDNNNKNINDEVVDNSEEGNIIRSSELFGKKIKDFLKTKQTKELIKAIKTEYNINTDDSDNLTYKLKNDVPFKYHGTYINEFLFDHALSWISKIYAIKISKLLKQVRNDYNQKLKYDNERLLNENKEKTCKIDELNNKIENLLKMGEISNNKLDNATSVILESNRRIISLDGKLIESNCKLTESNDKIESLNNTVNSLDDNVTTLTNTIQKITPMVVIPNTVDKKYQQYFSFTHSKCGKYVFIKAGQKRYHDKDLLNNDLYYNVEMKPNSNPIDLKVYIRYDINKLHSNIELEIASIRENYHNKKTEIDNKISIISKIKTTEEKEELLNNTNVLLEQDSKTLQTLINDDIDYELKMDYDKKIKSLKNKLYNLKRRKISNEEKEQLKIYYNDELSKIEPLYNRMKNTTIHKQQQNLIKKIKNYEKNISEYTKMETMSENVKDKKLNKLNKLTKINKHQYDSLLSDLKNKLKNLPTMYHNDISLNGWSFDKIKELIDTCVNNQRNYKTIDY